ncbi:DUF2970 domain-containing protein [Marinobacter halophilus]|uniref:DUF2970 domain-containing protein n=1 Tax=Marinobacter halophilus TaxID=1323740 RepID=A0A2T1K8A5_9GAMM|nr:DUF2970 domain-containing protein [Marinobacter halophilus]PSF06369.1 hypothetical protein C7H08_14720 [Marinobacter halophilus]GGC71979.1 hypothetical protein GCM10011362_20610 [Marinobacter halophilus]
MNDLADNKDNKEKKQPGSPGVLKIMQTVFAGALGVQSEKRRQEDFAGHSPVPYIVAGLLFGAVFVGGLILVVNLVLASQ